MIYLRKVPSGQLRELVACYWIVDSEDDAAVARQKIIPDGFPEIILHYGRPYRICISGTWEEQSLYLVAGQIKNHFFLENTGVCGMVGIKLQPTALFELFGMEMDKLTDRVEPFSQVLGAHFAGIQPILSGLSDHEQCIAAIERWLLGIKRQQDARIVRKALDLIFESQGMVEMKTLLAHCGVVERHLERLFKKQVGLSPKFYSRIIRFSRIFELTEENLSWAHLAFKSGFTDQSHFIKNFKEFTGEDPSKYLFGEESMANFFLRDAPENHTQSR